MGDNTVAKNRVVSLAYSIYDQKGELFEYTDVPVSYVHGGYSDLFEKIEAALEGRAVGDKVEVVLSPEEGFGRYDNGLTFTDDLENVPQELRQIGLDLEAQNATGEAVKFVVTQIDQEKGTLTVDANHPLAGQTVKFLVEVKAIRDATPDEIKTSAAESMFGNTLH